MKGGWGRDRDVAVAVVFISGTDEKLQGVAAGNVLLLQQPLFGNLQQHFPAAFSGSAYLLNCLPSWSISKFSRRISSEIGTNSYPFSFKIVMTESRASAVYFAPLCIRMMEPSPRCLCSVTVLMMESTP